MVDEVYLAAIRKLPCVVCGYGGDKSDAAHIRMSGAGWGIWGEGEESTGGGMKPSDYRAVPLCRPRYSPDPVARALKPDSPIKLVNVGCHGRQHGHDAKVLRELTDDPVEKLKLEEAFWRATGKNPFMIAATLYAKFGSGLVPRKKRRAGGKPKKDRKPRQTITPKGFGKQARPIPSRPFPKTKRKMR